jgi:RNA polymerase sigma-70 factor (ECF subfamily)
VTGRTTVLTDQDLVSACLQGDRRAFGELVNRHRDEAVAVVYRISSDAQLAEESAQEAFLRAWQRLYSYKPQLPFRSWIFGIAVHTALDTLRKTSKEVDIDQVLVEAPDGKPEAELEAKERQALIQRAVLSLPPACRAVLILREYECLSYQEIAAALDIPVGTVMSRLNYARGQLRQTLAPLLMESR